MKKIKASLSKKPKQSCKTRWNSIVDMIDSVLPIFSEIKDILREKRAHGRIRFIKEDTLKAISTFYAPWRQAYKLGSISLRPSIHWVSVIYEKLHLSCAIEDNDSSILKSLKRGTAQGLEQKVLRIIKKEMLAANILNPVQKSLPDTFKNRFDEIITFIVNLLQAEIDNKEEADLPQPPRKKIAISKSQPTIHNFFSTVSRPIAVPVSSSEVLDARQMIGHYLEDTNLYSLSQSAIENNPLLFWKLCSEDEDCSYSALAKIAERIFSILAGSVPSEQSFARLKRVVTDKSNRLKPVNTNYKMTYGQWLHVKDRLPEFFDGVQLD